MNMLLWTLLLSLAMVPPAFAIDYYVSSPSNTPFGSDLYSCDQAKTITTPRATIRNGWACLSPGDRLLIRGGLYQESIIDSSVPGGTSWSAPITVRGYENETVNWTGNPGCHFPDYCRYALWLGYAAQQFIILEHLIFHGNGQQQGGIIFAAQNAASKPHDFILRFVEIHNVNGNFLQVSNADNVLVEDVFFHDNCCVDVFPSGDRLANVGTYIGHNTNLTFNRARHDNVVGGCIQLFDGDPTGGESHNFTLSNSILSRCGVGLGGPFVTLGDAVHARIFNNVMYNGGCPDCGPGGTPSSSGIQIGHSGFAVDVGVYHNTFVDNFPASDGGFVYVQDAAVDIFIQNNIFWQTGPDFTFIIPGVSDAVFTNNLQNTNPLFAGAATHDYHLTENSQARIGGTAVPGVPLDLDGNPWPSPPGRGAYTYGAFSPVQGTFYVSRPTNSPPGSDANDCVAAQSLSTPLETFAKAFSCAAGGSTIFVRGGTYNESLLSATTPIAGGVAGAHTTIAAYSPGGVPETVILRQTAAGVRVLDLQHSDHHLTFDHLIFDAQGLTNTAMQMDGATNIRISNSEIRGAIYRNLVIGTSTNVEILKTVIHANVQPDEAAVDIRGSTAVRLAGGYIMESPGRAFHVEGGSADIILDAMDIHGNGGVGVEVFDASNTLLSNNLLYTNGGGGILLGSGASTAKLYHNTVWGNTGFGLQILAGALSTLYTNNIFYQNGADTPSDAGMGTTPTTNVIGSPSFIAPFPPTTFHVNGANAVHAGTTLTAITTDFAGKGRSSPPGYTIGAYQDDLVASPPSVSLSAAPTNITVGGSSTLTWTSTNATSCSAPWTATTTPAGSQVVSPTTTTTYTITCTDGTTPVTANAMVTVAATPGVSLVAIPQSIGVGGTATLSWTGSNVTSCSAPWTALTAPSGSQAVAPSTTTSYTITCNPGGVTSATTITVTATPPSPLRGLPYSSSMLLAIP